MRTFILRLDKKQDRPVILLENSFTALLDTGAYFPIWTDDEDILVSDLNAKFIKKNIPISGFGGTTYGNLYQVTIKLGELIFPNMNIVANNDLNTSYSMIVSATMFRHLRYEIDDENHVLTVTVPDKESNVRNLVIKDCNGKLHVLCSSDRR